MCDFNCDTCTLDICEDCEDILADIDERNEEMVLYNYYLKAKTPDQKKYRKNIKHFREYNRKYYSTHKEQSREACRRYYNKHIDEERARARKYYHEHLEAKRAYHNAYKASHREYYNQLEYNRRILNKDKYNEYMRIKNKECRIRQRLRGIEMKVGTLIKVSKYCVSEYINELNKCGVSVKQRPDLAMGKWVWLEITELKYEGKTYGRIKESD